MLVNLVLMLDNRGVTNNIHDHYSSSCLVLNHKLIAIIVSSYRQLIPCLDKKLPNLLLSIVGYSHRLCRVILNEELKHDVIMVVTSTVLTKHNYSITHEIVFLLSLFWKPASVSKGILLSYIKYINFLFNSQY